MSSTNVDTDKVQKVGLYATLPGYGSGQLMDFSTFFSAKNTPTYQWGPQMQVSGAPSNAYPADVKLLNLGAQGVVSGVPSFVYSTAPSFNARGKMMASPNNKQDAFFAVGSSNYAKLF